MDLKSERELANTCAKLRRLETLYEAVEMETDGDEEVRDAERESLKRLINQLKEEIGRFHARSPAHR